MDMALIPESSANKSTTVRTKNRAQPFSQRALKVGLNVLSAVSASGAAAVAERFFVTPKRYPRPAVELEALQSARHLLVPANRDQSSLLAEPLAAWEWGHEGPRVLLVHGWEGRGAQLAPFVEPLLAKGFRVVTFDAPGHGNSAGEVSSLVHFAQAIEAVVQAYGPFEAIITHSMGGAATAWALRNGPLAKRLVMLCPPIAVQDFTRQLTQALSLSDSVRTNVERRLARRFGVAPEALHVAKVAPNMRTPLLLVHDQDDREVPIACGEAIAESWPGATLVRTQGLGHRRILRDPKVIAQAVRFVAGA